MPSSARDEGENKNVIVMSDKKNFFMFGVLSAAKIKSLKNNGEGSYCLT